MSEGTIKRLVTERGFGFISNAPADDIFFHMSAVEGVTYDELQEGQKVQFTQEQGEKGPRAVKVSPVA